MVTSTLHMARRYPPAPVPATRRSQRRVRALVALGSLMLAVAVQVTGVPAAHADTIVVYDLGVLPGAVVSEAYAINSKGYAVGYSDDQAAAWNPDRSIFPLTGLPGAIQSRATDINYGNYAVGWSWVDGTYKALIWGDLIGQGAQLAPGYPGDTMALTINDHYDVYGVARPFGTSYWLPVQFVGSDVQRITAPTTYVQPVMAVSNKTSSNVVVGQTNGCPASCANQGGYEYGIGCPGCAGTMSLPPLTGSPSTIAAAVSADGTTITGVSGAFQHAVTWTLGQTSRGYPTWTVRDLGSPPVTNGTTPRAAARGINPAGTEVVGAAWGDNYTYAFRWLPKTGIQLLPPLSNAKYCPGSAYSIDLAGARDINANGLIVGASCRPQAGTSTVRTHAVEWVDIPVR